MFIWQFLTNLSSLKILLVLGWIVNSDFIQMCWQKAQTSLSEYFTTGHCVTGVHQRDCRAWHQGLPQRSTEDLRASGFASQLCRGGLPRLAAACICHCRSTPYVVGQCRLGVVDNNNNCILYVHSRNVILTSTDFKVFYSLHFDSFLW